MTDFAPTIAALLGVELPNVDGKPIAALCGASQKAPDRETFGS
jgi:hypothetical protein